MHFPRFWIIAHDKQASAWGWSDQSVAEADRLAAERLARIKDWLSHRSGGGMRHRYGYDRPMREEVLKEFRASDGSLRAAITRNSYGCLVLNTTDLLFVDVDAPEAKASGWLAGLFGFRKPVAGRGPEAFLETLLARVSDWVGRWPGWGWRVYCTAAGARLLATHEPFGPDHAMTQAAFEAFEADQLYRKLCATQKCFRARLTPKPWRCGVEKPRGRWPWANEKTEARFRKWESGYAEAAATHATCRLVGQFGRTQFHPDLQELITLHDTATRAESALRLA